MKRLLVAALLWAAFCRIAHAQEITLVVDTAYGEILVNKVPLLDDTDFKTRETAVAYNASGMDLVWNFTGADGAFTQTAVTPTTGGVYDWTHQGDGIYTIEIPASGGGSVNNDTEGCGFFAGLATGVLPWVGPIYCFTSSNTHAAMHGTGTLLNVNTSTISSNALTASAINADAFTAAKFASDVATEFQTGLYQLKKNTATATDRIKFFAYDTNGALTKTASAVTCQISLDGGAPATVTDTPAEVEFTVGATWKFGLTQAETNAEDAAIICTGTGLADTAIYIEFQH